MNASVLESYRLIVRSYRRDAVCRYVRDKDGQRWYRIVAGNEILSGDEGSMALAWREAAAFLSGATIGPIA